MKKTLILFLGIFCPFCFFGEPSSLAVCSSASKSFNTSLKDDEIKVVPVLTTNKQIELSSFKMIISYDFSKFRFDKNASCFKNLNKITTRNEAKKGKLYITYKSQGEPCVNISKEEKFDLFCLSFKFLDKAESSEFGAEIKEFKTQETKDFKEAITALEIEIISINENQEEQESQDNKEKTKTYDSLSETESVSENDEEEIKNKTEIFNDEYLDFKMPSACFKSKRVKFKDRDKNKFSKDKHKNDCIKNRKTSVKKDTKLKASAKYKASSKGSKTQRHRAKTPKSKDRDEKSKPRSKKELYNSPKNAAMAPVYSSSLAPSGELETKVKQDGKNLSYAALFVAIIGAILHFLSKISFIGKV